MNREQYLLMKLAEEASEVAQIALKNIQFGLENDWKGEPNKQLIYNELNDMLAVVGMLNAEVEGFDFCKQTIAMALKEQKVNEYWKLSKRLGRVVD